MKKQLFLRIIKATILAIAFIGVIWATRYFNLFEYITPQRIREFVLSFGLWSPLIFIGAYLVRTFFLFSSTVLAVTAGLSFGPLWGTLYTVIGATLSSSLAFLLARFMGEDFLEWILHRFSPAAENLDEKISKQGFWIILFLRVVPILPYDVINFGAGFSKMRFWPFFWSTLIGLIPSSFAFNFLGRSLLTPRDPRTILALILVLTIFIAPNLYRLIKRIRRKQNQEKTLQDHIKKAARILKSGGVIAFPTETVFGMGAALNQPAAIQRIFQIKNRPAGKPLQILVANLSQAKKLGKFNKNTLAFAKKHWPGPYTLVVPKTKKINKIISGGSSNVGLRMPDHKVALALIKKCGPIVATSANRAGKKPALSVKIVKKELPEIDYILSGRVKSGKASRVIDTTQGFKPLRP